MVRVLLAQIGLETMPESSNLIPATPILDIETEARRFKPIA